MQSIIQKNDNSANLGLLIMSPDPFISTMGIRSINSEICKIF